MQDVTGLMVDVVEWGGADHRPPAGRSGWAAGCFSASRSRPTGCWFCRRPNGQGRFLVRRPRGCCGCCAATCRFAARWGGAAGLAWWCHTMGLWHDPLWAQGGGVVCCACGVVMQRGQEGRPDGGTGDGIGGGDLCPAGLGGLDGVGTLSFHNMLRHRARRGGLSGRRASTGEET